MADFWIKVEKSTPDKPEVFEIAQILNMDPDAVLGKLIRFWIWADSNSDDGHIKSVTNVLIDRVTMSPGFADAMRTAGWLDENNIPNFSRHLGQSAKKRANDSERKRKSRNVTTKSVKCHKESVTETGLDKSREDKIKSKDIKKRVLFKPPEPQAVSTYMVERGISFNQAGQESEKFVDFYASKGWLVGKSKMKDWKAAVRNWLKNVKADTTNDIFTDESWLSVGNGVNSSATQSNDNVIDGNQNSLEEFGSGEPFRLDGGV